MFDPRLTRRTFLASAGAASALGLAACGAAGDRFVPDSGPVVVYRLSTRGVSSASNAAKIHAANKRFATMAAADAGRAHPGDKSKIVPLTISRATYELWFGSGAGQTDVADLRT